MKSLIQDILLGPRHRRCGSPIVITLSVCPSVRLSVCPSVCPSVCLSVCPSTLCCNAITQKSLNLQTLYFIHGKRIGKGRHLYIWKEDRERKTPIHFGVKRLKVTWSLTYFWKTLTLATTFCCNAITQKYLNVQTSYLVHRWRIGKGIHLYTLGSKG